MSAGLATGGYVGGASSDGAAPTGPSGTVIAFLLVDDDGAPAGSIDLSAAGVTKVSKNGGAMANRAGAAPAFVTASQNSYVYTCDASEVDTDGFVLLQINKAGYKVVVERENIGDPATATGITDAQATIIAAVIAAFNSTSSAISSMGSTVDSHTDAVAAPLTTALTAIQACTDRLEAHLTNTRIGYLDNLVGGGLAPTVVEINAYLTSQHGTGSWRGRGGGFVP